MFYGKNYGDSWIILNCNNKIVTYLFRKQLKEKIYVVYVSLFNTYSLFSIVISSLSTSLSHANDIFAALFKIPSHGNKVFPKPQTRISDVENPMTTFSSLVLVIPHVELFTKK